MRKGKAGKEGNVEHVAGFPQVGAAVFPLETQGKVNRSTFLSPSSLPYLPFFSLSYSPPPHYLNETSNWMHQDLEQLEG